MYACSKSSTGSGSLSCTYCLRRFGKSEEGIEIISELRSKNLDLDSFMYKVLISNLCEKENVEEAFNLYKEMCGKSIVPDLNICYILVKALRKAGEMESADHVLCGMSQNGPKRFCDNENVTAAFAGQ